MHKSAEEIQRSYYTDTASSYDEMHTSAKDDEHYSALAFIELFCLRFDIYTLLDVGAGTGRGVSFMLSRNRDVRGIEPVRALIEQAERRGVAKGVIVEGNGCALPFADNAFDAVFECGVLHHVANPARVVDEMMRVASRAVFLSDANRFGQGSFLLRLFKIFAYKFRFGRLLRWIQTGGKMYTLSEGDGLAYSYSVFDSYDQLAKWSDEIYLISTEHDSAKIRSWMNPLATARSVLLCAIKKAHRG